jgi:hypothetical protein
MAHNEVKFKGQLKSAKPSSGGTIISSEPMIGVVKNNFDPNRSGRIKVYLGENAGSDPENPNNWITVGCLSGFFGRVNSTAPSEGFGSYINNSSSYGEWHAPPDIGTYVVCVFIGGRPDYGFYIGCIPDPESLHMVPAVGASISDGSPGSAEKVTMNSAESSTYGGAPSIPVTNINTNNEALANSTEFLKGTKPAHSYTSAIMMQQGIIRDSVRGPISSSAQREASSRVGWGVSTPGRPIYEGGYDDEGLLQTGTTDTENLKIISRRGGHSIVMDDGDVKGKDQLIRIRTSKGHEITMSDDGQTLTIIHSNGQSYIELGKEGTIDMYSTNSVNIRTQGDLNLHADNNVNIHAAKDLNIQAENMNVATTKALKQSIGTNYLTSALGLVTLKTVGALSLSSVGPASLASTFTTFINGAVINLNTGKTPIKPLDVTPVPLTAHTDTLFSESKGFCAAPGKLLSVTSRAPAHMPWAHAGQGVDLKIDLTGAGQLPKKPSSLVSSVVKTGLSKGLPSIALPTALSVPSIKSISTSLTQSATSALVGVTGQKAASGPFSEAISKGTTIVNTAEGKLSAVGSFAQSPKQLAASGILKPGSHKLVESLISSGANITQSMPDSLFTGVSGAENLEKYITNIQPQTNGVIKNLQTSESALRNIGIITGNEAPEQIAGVVYSGTSSGIAKTVNTIKNSVNSTTIESSVINDIGVATSSTAAVLLASGGLGALTESVNGLITSGIGPTEIDTARGTTGTSYSAIVQSFPDLKSGAPTNLVGLVLSKELATDSISKSIPGTMLSGSTLNISNLNPTSLLQSTSISSGISNLPGGINAISSFKNVSLGKIPLQGTEQLSSLISSSATNAINGVTGSLSSLTGGVTGSLSSLTGGVTGSLSSLTGGVTGSLSSLTGGVTGSLSSLTGGVTGSLSSLTSSLSLGSAIGITSAISSVKSLFGGKGGVRSPSVAVNTVNRAPIDTKVKQLLGDERIPVPDFSANGSESGSNILSRQNQVSVQIASLSEKINNINDQIVNIKKSEGQQLLVDERQAPAGDRNIKQRKEEYKSKLNSLFIEKEELETQKKRLLSQI